jgi:hypothetical protein
VGRNTFQGWGAELLPCDYFHVVFTLPAPLAALALHLRLHLLVSDITPNGLLIRRTKFQKTR